jgi:hypothetical protein
MRSEHDIFAYRASIRVFTWLQWAKVEHENIVRRSAGAGVESLTADIENFSSLTVLIIAFSEISLSVLRQLGCSVRA